MPNLDLLDQKETYRRLGRIAGHSFVAAEGIKNFDAKYRPTARSRKEQRVLHTSAKAARHLLDYAPDELSMFLRQLALCVAGIHTTNDFDDFQDESLAGTLDELPNFVASLKLFEQGLLPEFLKEFNTHTSESAFNLKVIPELTDFVEICDWLDNIIKGSEKLASQNSPTSRRANDKARASRLEENENYELYSTIHEQAHRILDLLTKNLKGVIRAIKGPLIDFVEADFSTGDQDDRRYYQALFKAKSLTLKRLGLDQDDIKRIRAISEIPYKQNDFGQRKVQSAFEDFFRVLLTRDFEEAQSVLDQAIENFPQTRRRSYTEKLMDVISHQLDDTGLTVLQRIINSTAAEQQESAIALMNRLDELGLDFGVVNRNRENALHYLKANHGRLSKYLSVKLSSARSTVSFCGKTPLQNVMQRFLAHEGNTSKEVTARVVRNLKAKESVTHVPLT